MNESAWRGGLQFEPFHPTIQDVEKLIADAANHPQGIGFLQEGDLGTVAIMFGTHAFTVEAAREFLKKEQHS